MTPSDESEMSVGVLLVCLTSLSPTPRQRCAPLCPSQSLRLSVDIHPLARVGQWTSLSSSSINSIMEVMVGGNSVCVVLDCLCTGGAYVCWIGKVVCVFVCVVVHYLMYTQDSG